MSKKIFEIRNEFDADDVSDWLTEMSQDKGIIVIVEVLDE